ncbi:VPLPA-CTERM protein sorting domain-containing protein [Albimonas donghaensis]|uniref:VPLPA-CTERM protein sorting domain-containing protein n=2 Tax=Albimonas donghaensis TaxID=356660 RepID=A0A1H2SF50_9RHOB|nr:VPLPA-CTERM protein sorting domain-containing protein [Albimonas donghaensis]
MFRVTFGSLAALALTTVAASAATFNAVGTSSGAISGDGTVTVTVSEFDPSWGTLDSVSLLVFSTASTASIVITNNGGTTETSTVKLNSSLTIADNDGLIDSIFPASPYASSDSTGAVELDPSESSGSLPLSTASSVGSSYLISLVDESNFVGVGTYSFGFTFDTGFETETGSNFTVAGSSLSDANVTVQYNYTAPPSAVPVPAALPLLGGGLALMGFVARRRRG